MEQLQRVQTENSALKQHATTLQSQNLIAEEQSIEAKEQQANDIYKRAVEAGDAELMSKADSLKSDLAIQKEKLRVAKIGSNNNQWKHNKPIHNSHSRCNKKHQSQAERR